MAGGWPGKYLLVIGKSCLIVWIFSRFAYIFTGIFGKRPHFVREHTRTSFVYLGLCVRVKQASCIQSALEAPSRGCIINSCGISETRRTRKRRAVTFAP